MEPKKVFVCVVGEPETTNMVLVVAPDDYDTSDEAAILEVANMAFRIASARIVGEYDIPEGLAERLREGMIFFYIAEPVDVGNPDV